MGSIGVGVGTIGVGVGTIGVSTIGVRVGAISTSIQKSSISLGLGLGLSKGGNRQTSLKVYKRLDRYEQDAKHLREYIGSFKRFHRKSI